MTFMQLYRPFRDFKTDPPFFRVFSPDSASFATDPRVLGSVTESVPVETLYYLAILLHVK